MQYPRELVKTIDVIKVDIKLKCEVKPTQYNQLATLFHIKLDK